MAWQQKGTLPLSGMNNAYQEVNQGGEEVEDYRRKGRAHVKGGVYRSTINAVPSRGMEGAGTGRKRGHRKPPTNTWSRHVGATCGCVEQGTGFTDTVQDAGKTVRAG